MSKRQGKTTTKQTEQPETPVKIGRPTVYKPFFCQLLIAFFDIEPYTDINIIHYHADGKTPKWIDKKRMPNKLPSLVDFAKSISVGVTTVYQWVDKECATFKEDFAEAHATANHYVKNHLIQNGLQGLYNPLFTKFVCINVTDMRDKKEVEIPDLSNFASMIQAARKARELADVPVSVIPPVDMKKVVGRVVARTGRDRDRAKKDKAKVNRAKAKARTQGQ